MWWLRAQPCPPRSCVGRADFEPKRNRLSAGVWGTRRQQMEWLTLLVLPVKFSKIIFYIYWKVFIFIENFANMQICIKWSEVFFSLGDFFHKHSSGFLQSFWNLLKWEVVSSLWRRRCLGKGTGLFSGIFVINWNGDRVNKGFPAVFLQGLGDCFSSLDG